jgi:hypothetical protein
MVKGTNKAFHSIQVGKHPFIPFNPKSSINIVARVHSRRKRTAFTRHHQLRSGWPPWARLCPWPLWRQLQGHRSLQCRQPGNIMSVQFPFFKLNSHVKAELTSSSASSSPASASSSSRSFPSTSPSSSPSSSSTSSSGCSVLRFLALGAVVPSQSNRSHDTYIQQCHALTAHIARACTYQARRLPPLQPPLPQHHRRRRFRWQQRPRRLRKRT